MPDIQNTLNVIPAFDTSSSPPKTGSTNSLKWSFILTVAGIALVLRLGTAFTRSESYPHPLYYDEGVYRQIAHSLVNHGTFEYPQGNPEIHRAPLYSFFLAAVFSLFGENVAIVLAFQCMMGVAVVVLLSRCVSKHVQQSRCTALTAGVVAAAGLAISPIALIYERRMMGEAVVTLPLVLGIVLWMNSHSTTNKKTMLALSIAAGGSLGVAILAKPALMLLPPFLACCDCLITRRHRFRRRLVQASCLVLGTVIAVSPWTVRNYNVTGKVIPVAVGGGKRLFLATVPRHMVRQVESDVVGPYYEGANPNGVLTFNQKLIADRELKALAISTIANDPINYLRLCADRTVRMWANSHVTSVVGSLNADSIPRTFRLGAAGLAAIILIIAFVGTAFCVVDRADSLTPLWATPLYVALIHAPLEGGGRYVVPAWPFVICMAAIAIGYLHNRRQNRSVLLPASELPQQNSIAA